MRKEELRIVYMGTPDFAVESLRRLVEGGYQVVGVVTMPDKAIGRHQSEVSQSPIKQYALSQGLPVLQPSNLKDEQFLNELRALRADLQVVVAFRMLPEAVWSMPAYGTFNLHASLLPQYRGAAPINWAVINGETETGVSTFFLDHQIDTGRIIHRQRCPISESDTAGSIHDRLMILGGDLVVQTINDILANNIHPTAQEELTDELPLRHAPKIFKETCRIDWQQCTSTIYNFVRGLSPYPAAWTTLHYPNGKSTVLKIYGSKKVLCQHNSPIGSVESDGKHYLQIALADGYLQLTEVQLSGKKRMQIDDFLRGFKWEMGLRVE